MRHRLILSMMKFLTSFLLCSVWESVALKMSFPSPDVSAVSVHESYRSSTKRLVLGTGMLALIAFKGQSVNAKVYFDTDVYGDKELKIATVNKIKQKLRNAILEDNSVASDLYKLAINDALGYSASTQDGGPDGSILYELERPENKGLEKAIGVITSVKKELQRTNVVSFSDLVSFAGAEALETIGGPRFTVQVGRFDAKSENKKPVLINWNEPTAENIKEAFTSSGVGPKDVALILGALGEINRVVYETKNVPETTSVGGDDEDVNSDDMSWQDRVPGTFGKRDSMYGKKMGKADFGTKYFASLLSKKPVPGMTASEEAIGKYLVGDDKVKPYIQKYAASATALLKDLPEAYLNLTLLGEAYTTRNS